MKKLLVWVFLAVCFLSCSFNKTENVTISPLKSTLTQVLNIRHGGEKATLSFQDDLYEESKKSGFIFHSYKKKNNATPYLTIKYDKEGNFISALYFPIWEDILVRKEDIFKVVQAADWKKKEEYVSPDDRTLKVYFLSLQENILFGYYEINNREIDFISIGSQTEPEVIKDLFPF